MPDQDGLFIQGMTCDGEEIDISYLTYCALVETLDLSGPKLIMKFRDPDSILRDDLGIKQGKEIEVTFADYWNDPEDSDELVDKYVVMTMPVVGESFTINCLQKDICSLKTPAATPILFVGASVPAVVRKLMPGVVQNIGKFPSGRDYHLLPGERPSKLLRQVAREMGAKVFYQRNTIFVQTLSEMLKVESPFTYAYENRQADYRIIHYSRPNVDYLIEDALVRSYRGWNMVDGLLNASRHQDTPACFVSGDTISVLDNFSVLSVPEVDFVVSGSGSLRPGLTLDLEWNLNRRDAPLDESLPTKIIIGTSSHFYSAQKYLTRIKGVLPL